ncbi:MAG: hypothetical protein U9R79_04725 [Armatimonadota bacterium]|nr:hypothetical protein [Armatimonadota bacterium]
MRRRPKWRAEMDLFPFLDGLSCALGVLMMIAISLICGRMTNVPEQWQIAGEMRSEARLVVWDGSQVVIDSQEGQTPVPWSAAKELEGDNDTAFGELLDTVEQSDGQLYILVAIRPSGFANYRELAELINAHNIDLGHWPVAQDKHVSLRYEEAEA